MILVTGGTGYIGSHTCVELINAGYDIIIVDNLSNSKQIVLERIKAITEVRPTLYIADIRDMASLRSIFSIHQIDAVIHFAGLKAVGESVAEPLRYYDNNVHGSTTLFSVMEEFNVRKIIFSSSAAVYGDPYTVPICEYFPTAPANPYGHCKFIVEQILEDMHTANNNWQIMILRYFNSVGAHESGLIGEDPVGTPNNLMPYICQVASGIRKELNVFGSDYYTADGTGIRDYIHVVDLSKGHLKALEYLKKEVLKINLGTGRGYSVLEMVKKFEKVTGLTIPCRIIDRRPGDIAQCYADPSRAKDIIDWRATLGLEEMCTDAWRWQSMNPRGYR